MAASSRTVDLPRLPDQLHDVGRDVSRFAHVDRSAGALALLQQNAADATVAEYAAVGDDAPLGQELAQSPATAHIAAHVAIEGVRTEPESVPTRATRVNGEALSVTSASDSGSNPGTGGELELSTTSGAVERPVSNDEPKVASGGARDGHDNGNGYPNQRNTGFADKGDDEHERVPVQELQELLEDALGRSSEGPRTVDAQTYLGVLKMLVDGARDSGQQSLELPTSAVTALYELSAVPDNDYVPGLDRYGSTKAGDQLPAKDERIIERALTLTSARHTEILLLGSPAGDSKTDEEIAEITGLKPVAVRRARAKAHADFREQTALLESDDIDWQSLAKEHYIRPRSVLILLGCLDEPISPDATLKDLRAQALRALERTDRIRGDRERHIARLADLYGLTDGRGKTATEVARRKGMTYGVIANTEAEVLGIKDPDWRLQYRPHKIPD